MGERQDEALAAHALKMAIAQRCPCLGLIHHTDQSVLYRARGYRQTLDQHGARSSMGVKGSPLDNAVVESFFSNLKNELVHHCEFATRNEAKAALFSYIELFTIGEDCIRRSTTEHHSKSRANGVALD